MARRDKKSDYTPHYPLSVLPESFSEAFFAEAGRLDERNPTVADTQDYCRNEAAVRVLENIYRREPFDAIYERYSLFGTAGRMVAARLGVPYVLEVNAPLVREAPQYRELGSADLARAVERYLFTSADHIVTVSTALRDYVINIAPGAQVTVVANGVNLERFNDEADGVGWRRRLAASDDDFVVGFVGRVRPWHGVEHLIDAVGSLAAADNSLRLCIVGNCGDLAGELADRCRAAGLDGRVTFTGAVAPDEIPAVLQSMDVLTAPYPDVPDFYFSPLKVFEYMAAARPIVASATGQIVEVLSHEKTALLVPPGDVTALADALGRLRRDPALRRKLGRCARADATANHSWAQRMETVAGILNELSNPAQTGGIDHANPIQAG
jgi:glycosyltransferase involved in cell wall biosynthesis